MVTHDRADLAVHPASRSRSPAFVVIILGGLGNVTGGLLAALLLGVIEVYGVALTSANLRSVLLYGTFVAALLIFPNGLIARRVMAR